MVLALLVSHEDARESMVLLTSNIFMALYNLYGYLVGSLDFNLLVEAVGFCIGPQNVEHFFAEGPTAAS